MSSFTSKTPKPILAPIRSNMFDGPAFAQIGARPGAIPGVAGSSAASAVSPPGAPAATQGGNLTTPWILFFNQLAQLAEAMQSAATPIIGWWMPGVLSGAIDLPILAAGRTGPVSMVVVMIGASDGSADLNFDILQNGTSIFETTPVIPAGTAAGSQLLFTNLTANPLAVTQNDIFTFNMIAGSNNWFFSAQVQDKVAS
jgi:hypothetical protein